MERNDEQEESRQVISGSNDGIHAAGEDRVNYCLSFVRGYLDSVGKTEILHEWDDETMRVKMTIGEQVH